MSDWLGGIVELALSLQLVNGGLVLTHDTVVAAEHTTRVLYLTRSGSGKANSELLSQLTSHVDHNHNPSDSCKRDEPFDYLQRS